MQEVRIPAFAKINLRLEILGKRPDGYHELRTIFQTVSLHDDLRLRRARKPGISLNVEGNVALSREPAEKNLVYRAVRALQLDYRAPLVLRDIEGLSTSEAAEILGVSEAALKSRLHRARAAVRNALGDQEELGR